MSYHDNPVELSRPSGQHGPALDSPRDSLEEGRLLDVEKRYTAEPTMSRRSRVLALVAVCTLSIGSHFAMYLLGPLKSRLHREMDTSNSQFSLLIASLSLNSTWTPLVGGLLIARFGTASSSVLTTGSVLVGLLVLFFGVTYEHLSLMAIGLFIFGLGMTPLAVVQETLLSHLSPTHHLGLSLALGLVSGKSASFLSSLLSLPLAQAGGDGAPFALALALAGVSFGANSARLMFGWGRGATGGVKKVVKWEGVRQLGDIYWIYILLNVLSGAIWQPFIHLSSNLVQTRFNLSETTASTDASTLLAGAVVLYPIVGYLTDRKPSVREGITTTFQLITTTSVLTLLCYLYLCLPPSATHTPWPGFVLFALGNGAATLLMVVIVPRIVSLPLVPLGLGIHKAMETASATGTQTLAGLWLDWGKGKEDGVAASSLIRAFAAVNAAQLVCVLMLWRQEGKRAAVIASQGVAAEEYERLPMGEMGGVEGEDGEVDGDEEGQHEVRKGYREANDEVRSGLALTGKEQKRGRIALFSSLGFILAVWVLFFIVAWSKL